MPQLHSDPQSIVRVVGHVHIALGHRDPTTGRLEVVAEQVVPNGTTDSGDTAYAARICNINPGGGAVPNVVTGMRLGTGTTVFAKSSTGSTLAAYLTGSARALDSTVPTAATGSGAVIAYTITWPAGTCPSANIREIVLSNQTLSGGALPAGAGTSGDTLARIVLPDPVDNTQSGGVDLVVTWNHTILGPST